MRNHSHQAKRALVSFPGESECGRAPGNRVFTAAVGCKQHSDAALPEEGYLSDAPLPVQARLMEWELLREVKGREVAEEYGHRKCQRKCQAAGPGRRLSGRSRSPLS